MTIIKTIAEVSTYICSAILFQKSKTIVNRSSCCSRFVRLSLIQFFLFSRKANTYLHWHIFALFALYIPEKTEVHVDRGSWDSRSFNFFCLVVKPTHNFIDTYLHCSLSTFQQRPKFMSLEVREIIAHSILFFFVVKPTHICIDTYLHWHIFALTHICIVRSLHSSKWAAMDERSTRRDRHQVRPRSTPQWKEALGASPLLR